MFIRVLSIFVTVCALAAIPLQLWGGDGAEPVITAATLEKVIGELIWYNPDVYEGLGPRCTVLVIRWSEKWDSDTKKYFDTYYGYIIKAPGEIYQFNIDTNAYGIYGSNLIRQYEQGMYEYIDKCGLYGEYSVRVGYFKRPPLPAVARAMIEEDIGLIEQRLAESIPLPRYTFVGLDTEQFEHLDWLHLSRDDYAYVRNVIDNKGESFTMSGDIHYYIGYLDKDFGKDYYTVYMGLENDISRAVFEFKIYGRDRDDGECWSEHYRRCDDYLASANSDVTDEQYFVWMYQKELAFFDALKRTSFFSGVICVEAPAP